VDFDRASVAGAEKVKRASECGSAQILDASGGAVQKAWQPRRRPIALGHISGSLNLPWRVVQSGEIKLEDEVKTLMAVLGWMLNAR
jgi:3-mercaptopyruvate sulfurtransferase SseA